MSAAAKNRSRGRGGGGKPSKHNEGRKDPEPSKYSEMFLVYRDELDTRHDKHERLVKLSRDCTIHSKRTIFTLHQFTGSLESKEKALSEAEAKLQSDVLPNLRSIALEIAGEDPHQHHRAYSPGVQEFIEALAYYKYLQSGRLISFAEAQKYLSFQPIKEKRDSEGEEEEEKCDPQKDTPEACEKTIESKESSTMGSNTTLQLNPSDFLLGLADLTGELMRLCINAVGSGNRELPFSLLPFFRALFRGFHSFSPGKGKYMGQKMSTLRASLGKVENVCYTLKVRGSEMPKHMLMDAINTNDSGEQNDV